LAHDTERLEEARAGFERLTLAQQFGDLAAEQAEVHGLAVLDDRIGQLEQAQVGYERALDLAHQLGDPAAESLELRTLGLFFCEHDEVERWRAMVEQSLAISEGLSDLYTIVKDHHFLAWIEAQQGNRTAAVAHLREALRCFKQVQAPEAEEVRAVLRRLGEQA
jgi:tetratricopeptide (TPR) repeat protein